MNMSLQDPEELALRLQSIIESAVDGIIIINEQGIIETFNPSASRLFGYTSAEVTGKNISILMPEPHRSMHDTYIQRYLETSQRHIIGIGREVLGQRKDGTIFPFFLSVSEAHVNGKRIFTGIVHDMTEQKNAAQKIQEYAKALERSNQELESFAYIVSHDLQEPLRKIQAFGERILRYEAKQLSTDGQDYLRRMLQAASRLQTLIEAILHFSRVTSRRRPTETLHFSEIVQEVLTDLEWQVERRRAKIIVEGEATFEAERHQMQQLLLNLLSNALKFQQPHTPPEIRISVSEYMHENTPCVRISIQDNGVGIEKEHIPKMFVIFQRLHPHIEGGTGIGLAICKKIVDQHGGKIEVESQPGRGTTFMVCLPKYASQKGLCL